MSKIDGRIYLFPVPVVKERKYLIACKDEAEAQRIQKIVKDEAVTHPDLISQDFVFLTYHTDKRTKIFVLRAGL